MYMVFCSVSFGQLELHLKVPERMTATIRNFIPFTNSTRVDPNSRNKLMIHFLIKER